MSVLSRCVHCGNEFNARTRKQKYCSVQCKTAYYRDKAPEIDGVCIGCGAPIKYKIVDGRPTKRYCSISCASKHTVPTKICKCIDCGIEFEFIGRTTKDRCEPCRRKHRSRLVMGYRARKDPTVMIGVGSGGWQNSNPEACMSKDDDRMRELRRELYALKKDSRRRYEQYKRRKLIAEDSSCSVCGYNKYKESLVVHHIDMNRRNNDEANLTILCRNCHEHIHKECRLYALKLHTKTPAQIYDDVREAEVKLRNEAGKPTGQSEPKATSNGGQGQSVVAGPTKDISYQEAATRK